jgi:hypothetical protein
MNQVLTLGGRAGTYRLRGLDPPVGIMQAQPALAPWPTNCAWATTAGQHRRHAVAGRAADVWLAPGVANGAAALLSVDADALFDPASRADQAVVSTLALGAHTGIRDLVAVTGGFLLLATADASQ